MGLLRPALWFILALLIWPPSAEAAESGPFALNLDIPAGKFKAIRLRNLPKDAVVAVKVETDGGLVVALVDSRLYRRGLGGPWRPLFQGRVEKSLSFSATIPARGDYFLILDNRSGQGARAARVTIAARASRPGGVQI
ncbi:MAG: hypothetical protein QHH30_05320 [candidate division NC10 bacterium]|nr:hypothetical protein [candidate division NC10 bacterium]